MDPDISAKLDEYLRNEPARQAEHEAFMADVNALIARLKRDTELEKAKVERARQSRLDLERRIEEMRRRNAERE